MERHPMTKPVFRTGIRDLSIQRLLGLLTEELDARSPSGTLYVDSLAYALATRYLLLDDACHTPESQTSALPQRILDRVKEKIEANLHMDLSLDNLARESGYSRSHFLRMFRVATGLTPHQYILDLRLKHAQRRIRHTTDSLIDIAALCGFSSQSHMTTVFRTHLDMTPAEFRRSL
jgi:AraC family transcriptional regulator